MTLLWPLQIERLECLEVIDMTRGDLPAGEMGQDTRASHGADAIDYGHMAQRGRRLKQVERGLAHQPNRIVNVRHKRRGKVDSIPDVMIGGAGIIETLVKDRPVIAPAPRLGIGVAGERPGGGVRAPRGAPQLLGLKPTTLEARMKRLGIARPGAGSQSS